LRWKPKSAVKLHGKPPSNAAPQPNGKSRLNARPPPRDWQGKGKPKLNARPKQK